MAKSHHGGRSNRSRPKINKTIKNIQKDMNVNADEAKELMADMYKILRDRTWRGALARLLLSLDLCLWSLLVYFLIDYQLFIR